MSRADHIASTATGRLFRGQTAIDFYGRRMIGLVVAIVLVIVTVGSLLTQGLNLGLDFEGGQAWDVPASETFDVADAEQVLADNGVSISGSKIQRRTSESDDLITVQIEVEPQETADALTVAFAEAAGVTTNDVSFSFTSSTWGRDITEQAARALVIFLVAVAAFISLRFEWRMAVAALAAMVHDVLIAVAVYTVFQFELTPATVIAFLTILGYSLYDTIVVFDRVKENEGKYAGVRMPYQDVVNISMNQVMMRSINTSLSSILPVISLLLVGSGLLGAVALSEFAIALLVGMIAGVYSSIFVASPILAALKAKSGRASRRERLIGDDLRAAVVGAGVTGRLSLGSDEPESSTRRRRDGRSSSGNGGEDDGGRVDDGKHTRRERDDHDDAVRTAAVHQPVERILSHPPRPRKKKRR